MPADRFVLLGLARARAGWFRSVAQWATSAALPADFVKCVGPEELRAHLRSARRFSAALLDAGLPAVDRDLLAAARDAGCAVVIVDDGHRQADWVSLGAAAVLPSAFTRQTLLDSLAAHADMITTPDVTATLLTPPGAARPAPWEAQVAAVCGPGGTGVSTAAIALSQGLALASVTRGQVLLADFRLRAEQAMLHDTGEVFPGIEELVESHRAAALSPAQVRQLTFRVESRGYDLLLGLRRARHWATLRPRAFEAAFRSLRQAFQVVVCDIDADFEQEEDAGSADVAERCMLAHTAVRHASAVFAVGLGGMKGLHGLARVVSELVEAGVAAERIQPVINLAPRHPRARAELAATFSALTRPADGARLASPVFLPRRKVDEALRDGARLPNPLPQMLAGAWRATAAKARGIDTPGTPQRVRPGSLGSWSIGPEEAAGA